MLLFSFEKGGLPWASLVAQMVKCLPAVRETWVRSLGQEDPLEKEMETFNDSVENEPAKEGGRKTKKDETGGERGDLVRGMKMF